MDLSEKKVIMVIAPENFQDDEYFQTRETLEKSGLNISVASIQKIAISGIEKKEVVVDMMLTEVTTDFDAIVFVGGGGAKVYFHNDLALNLVKKFYEEGKIVAAICIAPLILAHAGIMADIKATIWEGNREDLIDLGVNYIGGKVAVDGKIITANGPAASSKFGKQIAKSLR